MQNWAMAFTSVFFGFIVWVIWQANQGQHTIFFDWVRAIPYGDKVGHLGLFGLLTLGLTLAFNLKRLTLGPLRLYWGAILVTAFVAIEELSQGLIPSRTLDWADFLANMAGILCASLMCWGLEVFKQARSSTNEE